MTGPAPVSLQTFEAGVGSPELVTYIQALEAFDAIPQLRELKAIEGQRAGYSTGMAVADIGCGFGLETLRLAVRVGPAGRAAGVDISPAFLAEARRRAAAAGVAIDVHEGRAEALPLANASFDAVRAERLLIYLARPEAALAEMRRIARPGAALALIEPDLGTTTVNLPDRGLVRRVMGHEADSSVAQGWLPGRLPPMLAAAGFSGQQLATRVLVFPVPLALAYLGQCGRSAARAGAITDGELAGWLSGLDALATRGELFATVGYFLFTARAGG
ncbi:MAG: methyltransferase domain-containing protein [Geminicoccaceae bacterium]